MAYLAYVSVALAVLLAVESTILGRVKHLFLINASDINSKVHNPDHSSTYLEAVQIDKI
jgi:hypothetical protein